MYKIYPWQKNTWNKLIKNIGEREADVLIYGSCGNGKSYLAKNLSRYILCQSSNPRFCSICNSCCAFESGTHCDFLYINSTPRIEATLPYKVWDFLKKKQKTGDGTKKVIFIQSAHLIDRVYLASLLSTVESNRLMKNITVILSASSLGRMPKNLVARFSVFKVSANTKPETIKWIINNTDRKANPILLMRLANNAPVQAIQYHRLGYLKIRDKILNHVLLHMKRGGQISSSTEVLHSIDSVVIVNILFSIALDVIITKSGTQDPALINFDIFPILDFFAKNGSKHKLQDYLIFLKNFSFGLEYGLSYNKLELYQLCVTHFSHCLQNTKNYE